MISEFRNLEISKVKDKLEFLLKQFEKLDKDKDALKEEYDRLLEEKTSLTSVKKPNKLQIFFKSSVFREYNNAMVKVVSVDEKMNILEEKENILDKDLRSIKNEIEIIKRTLNYKSTIPDSVLLKETSFIDIINILNEKEIPIVINEKEKELALNQDKAIDIFDVSKKDDVFTSTSQFVMIHKTDFIPQNNKINSTLSSGGLNEGEITLGGKKYTFYAKGGRDTVHFATNHEVSSHWFGNWEKCRYAVIIPFDDLQKQSKIGSARSVDTYTVGPAQLTENSYILCPKGEGKKIKDINPLVKIVEYEGEYVSGYADAFISMIGYKIEHGNEHGFEDSKQANAHCELVSSLGLTTQRHANSSDKKRETILSNCYSVAAVFRLIMDKGISLNISREQLLNDFVDQRIEHTIKSIFYNGYGEVLIEIFKEYDIPTSSINVSDFDSLSSFYSSYYSEFVNTILDDINLNVTETVKHIK